MTAGVGAVTNTMAKIVGAQVLKDLQMFVAAFDTLFGGFRNRAQQTFELLQTQETAFLVVAAPEADALREAAYFVERLDSEDMPLAGLVVNRATPALEGLSAEQAVAAAERLETGGRRGPRRHGRAAAAARRPDARGSTRETRMRGRFQAAHPHVPTVVVPALSTDVHDLDGLRRVGRPARRLTSRRQPPYRERTGGDPRPEPGVAAAWFCPVGVARQALATFVAVSGLALRRLEDAAPRDDVRPLAEDGPALALGHASPDAPLDLVVEGLGEALGPHRATGTHLLRAVLRGAADEQLVRTGLLALCLLTPSRHSSVICVSLFSQTCSPKQAVEEFLRHQR